ncbi:hypothetical protein BKA70DRAFT_1206657 [Coprinopsis sp. MPI-PUGE-AT-0042]|nr:hypothetical protein BKA70DRAFT_1206657 [Coprinopsis sp. MPI-PUGE-AT-0042]
MHTHYNSYTYYNVFNAPSPQRPRIYHPTVAPAACACSTDGAITDTCKPNLFPVVENTLELMIHLVESPAGFANIFHRISPDLRVLVQLVAFSSTAYNACNGQTPIRRLIRSAIDSGLSTCNRRLVALHQEMLILPHRSVPLVRSVCRTICQWWTANEPEEITLIRPKLNAEMTAFAEWLACLNHLLFEATTRFSWKDLEQFFNSSPVLLKELHVDKIIIIEPLQGDHLGVPVRFVTSFEDVHHVLQAACQGTIGARYIEGRQYQLDGAETNEVVNPIRFLRDCLKDGKAFEVAIKLVQREPVGLNICPRCACLHQDEKDKINGWINAVVAKTQFNTRITEVTTARQEEVDTTDILDVCAESPATGATAPRHAQHNSDTPSIFTLFRRLIIDILEVKEVPVDDFSPSQEAPAGAMERERMGKAFVWPEQGKHRVRRELETFRTPFASLEQVDPQLAKCIFAVSTLLKDDCNERGTLGDGVDPKSHSMVTLAEGEREQVASKDWDELLNQAREIPGFENFLRPNLMFHPLPTSPRVGSCG